MLRKYVTHNNTYWFFQGRVSCSGHGLVSEPVFGPVTFVRGCLSFRTSAGRWLTTPVVEVV